MFCVKRTPWNIYSTNCYLPFVFTLAQRNDIYIYIEGIDRPKVTRLLGDIVITSIQYKPDMTKRPSRRAGVGL